MFPCSTWTKLKHYDAVEKIMPPNLLEASSRRCPCAEREMSLDLKFISQKAFPENVCWI